MNNRWKTGMVALGLMVIAVPTIGAARTHYTGKVPASIALDPVPLAMSVTPAAPAAAVRTVSHKAVAHKKVLVKKKAAVKHAAVKKHHKRHKKAVAG